jgi:hypothetical protein
MSLELRVSEMRWETAHIQTESVFRSTSMWVALHAAVNRFEAD